MTNKNSQIVITFQILISFLLSVFGNKISELFSLKPIYVILIVVLLLLITIVLSIPKQSFKIDTDKIDITISQSKIFIIPIFFLFGSVVSAVLIIIFKAFKVSTSVGFTFYISEENGQEFYIYLYEILSYISVAYLVWFTKRIDLNFKLMLISVFGASTGIAISIFTFDPDKNFPLETFFGGFLTSLLIISIIEFVHLMKLQLKKSSS